MTTQSSTILNAFNDHFMEFVNDIINVFPNDTDILAAKNSFMLIRKANPKMIIKIWHKQVVEKYEKFIDEGNISFFINKDYKDDLTNTENSEKITEAIDRLRNPVKLMTEEDQEKVMKYIQNLKKLSTIYINM
jgi:hypothetical protein